jgi:phosphate transport system permease protein
VSESASTFTGRRRDRKTRPGVKVADHVARTLITLGGIGTIIAVSTVCIFLVAVAWPLFSKARMGDSQPIAPPWAQQQLTPVHIAMDEYQLLGWAMFEDGSVRVFRSDTGEAVGERRQPLGDERVLSALSFNSDGDDVCFGFQDGYAQLGEIKIDISFLGEQQVPEAMREIPIGEVGMLDDTLYAHTQPGQFRQHTFTVTKKPAVKLSDEPIRLIGHTVRRTGPVIVALAGESLAIYSVSEIRNFLSGAVAANARRVDLPYETRSGGDIPAYLMLSGLGDIAYLAWADGYLRRYDTRTLDNPQLVETLDLAPGEGNSLTMMRFLIGRTTLVSGDAQGRVQAWFCVPDDTKIDRTTLVAAHDLGKADSAVTALSGSARSRLLAAGYADGRVRLFHVTANSLLVESERPTDSANAPVSVVSIGAREDRLLAASPGRLFSWRVDRRYPAINLHALFGKVWYEGYAEPQHMWQSSSGTDDFEPKYGLVPLIFGTIKATFYSLLFGLPIALLAAIFTSEFMHPKVKARVKPLVEMMASLPSVVLGFLAALVIAPFVENAVPAVLASFVMLPLAFLLGAYGWQLMPRAWALRLEKHRFLLICLMVPLGVWGALRFGPLAEKLLFAGDFKRWMDGQIGTGAGGWFMLLAPLTAILTGFLFSVLLRDRFRDWTFGWTRVRVAQMDALKFLAGLACWVALTAAGAWLLAWLGFDPRGDQMHHFLGTYVQRNAMVVGFIMGFAIIPIIYTLSEDALSSVPEHLRSASLGAGATKWQTAIRIIVPTAMSGLFSAAMIGLGRAVGETMIVLMAAGNTPVMQMNFFNGFRTLSANIAVEMPEAPVGGTHYRVLFLAALSLFAMTFIINTFAEMIRQRFRKRAFQL